MTYKFTRSKPDEVLKSLGKEKAIEAIEKMTLIRNFEIRAESAYQQGKIGGFFHAYMGQEAIQTGAVMAMGVDENWWLTTYRCHALALLMGVTPDEAMAEFYGKETGIAKGRGGSMHLCHDRMLGGYGIVGGHLPAAAGAAFSLKYQKKDGVAVGFLGDGASVQGAFHETMNLASLWDLPLIIVIENNLWGMGTAVDRAVCVEPIAENFAKAYGIESVTLDGMNFFDTYHGFKKIYEKVKKTKRPILVEAVTERFRGHSISDPALYRSKDELKKAMAKDPITLLQHALEEKGILKKGDFDKINEKAKQIAVSSMEFAEKSPEPSIATLEEGVMA